MPSDPLEELSDQGFPGLAWELRDNPQCLVYSDPRKDRFGEILKGLIQFYADEDKREYIEVKTSTGNLRREVKGNKYLVVCPGYEKSRLQTALKS